MKMKVRETIEAVLRSLLEQLPEKERPVQMCWLWSPYFDICYGASKQLYSLTWDIPGYTQPTIPVMRALTADIRTVLDLDDPRFQHSHVHAFQDAVGVPEFLLRGQTHLWIGYRNLLGGANLCCAPLALGMREDCAIIDVQGAQG
jgi:hypothetical protein